MKIAVITAIFGGKDTPKPFPQQSIDCDYYCFTEQNTPVPLPNLPDRLKAKYFKLQMQTELHGYDTYIWIDGNIEVKSPDFVKKMIEDLQPGSIAIQQHHERQNIKQEIDFILASDNAYLTTRYGNQPLKQEFEHYKTCGMPEDWQLYACNIFAFRKGATDILYFMDWWWNLVLIWSWFDQSAFSFLSWTYRECVSITPIKLGPMFNNDFFALHPHAKPLE